MIKRLLLAFLACLGLAQTGLAQQSVPEVDVSSLPPAVARLTLAVASIPGIASVDVVKTYLPDIPISDLMLPGPSADLPAAILRRSGGGLPKELLLSINFTISRDDSGLKALEFLAWWARDMARSGHNIQLRALALPPLVGEKIQLGETLHFTVDWFYIGESESVEELMRSLENLCKSLEMEIEQARPAF